MKDFLPPAARPHERAVLLCFYVMGITYPKDIALMLGYKSTTEIYRILKKYRDVKISCVQGHTFSRTYYLAPLQSV